MHFNHNDDCLNGRINSLYTRVWIFLGLVCHSFTKCAYYKITKSGRLVQEQTMEFLTITFLKQVGAKECVQTDLSWFFPPLRGIIIIIIVMIMGILWLSITHDKNQGLTKGFFFTKRMEHSKTYGYYTRQGW